MGLFGFVTKNELNKELETGTGEIGKISREIAALKNEVAFLQKQNRATVDLVMQLILTENRTDILYGEYEKNPEKHAAHLIKSMENDCAEFSRVISSADNLHTRIRQTINKVLMLEKEYNRAEHKIQKTFQSILNISTALKTEAQKKHSTLKEKYLEDLARIETLLINEKKRFEDSKKRLSSLINQINSFDRTKELKEDVEILKRISSSIGKEKNNDEIKKNYAELSKIAKTLIQYKNSGLAIKDDLHKVQAELTSLQHDLNSLSSNISPLRSELAQMLVAMRHTTKIKNIKRTYKEMKSLATTIISLVDNYGKRHHEITNDLRNRNRLRAKAQIEELEKEVKQTISNVTKLISAVSIARIEAYNKERLAIQQDPEAKFEAYSNANTALQRLNYVKRDLPRILNEIDIFKKSFQTDAGFSELNKPPFAVLGHILSQGEHLISATGYVLQLCKEDDK